MDTLPAVTSIPYNEEEIQTIGGMTDIISKNGQSSLIIRNTGNNVSYIEIESINGNEKIQVTNGSDTYISVPVKNKSVVIKAFDKNDKDLYYYVLDHENILSYLSWKRVIK